MKQPSNLELRKRTLLRQQLALCIYDTELHSLWNGIAYPHYLAVGEFAIATTSAARKDWLDCLKHFVAKRAPTNRPDELETVGTRLVHMDWSVAPMFSRQMAQLYVDGRYVDVNERLPGKSHDKPNMPFGKPILAAAVCLDNAHAVEFLLEAGANRVIGTRRSDCQPISIEDYAMAVGAKRCSELFERIAQHAN